MVEPIPKCTMSTHIAIVALAEHDGICMRVAKQVMPGKKLLPEDTINRSR